MHIGQAAPHEAGWDDQTGCLIRQSLASLRKDAVESPSTEGNPLVTSSDSIGSGTEAEVYDADRSSIRQVTRNDANMVLLIPLRIWYS